MVKKVYINNPLNWVESGLDQSIKAIYFEVDEDNCMKGLPVILYDPTRNPVTIGGQITLEGTDSAGATRLASISLPSGLSFPLTLPGVHTVSADCVYNVDTGKTELLRTPTVYKQISVSAGGDTALWTPAGGKKFRLMGFCYSVASNATTAAGTVGSLRDNAAYITRPFSMTLTTTSLFATVTFPGNGILSAAADQVLYWNFTNALTAGTFYVTAWGTEE